MKLFHLYRVEDISGVSGTGPVVEGVEFTNGWCALRWITDKSSVCFYQSLSDVRKVHGHGGRTELVVHDFEPQRDRSNPESTAEFEIFLQVIEETSTLLNLEAQPESESEMIHRRIESIKSHFDRLENRLTNRLSKAA